MGLPAALTVIGEVRTGYADTEGTPIQAGLNRAEHAVIEIAEPYRDGLDGLAGFGYAWLLTWLDRPHEEAPPPLRLVPFLLRHEQRKVGVFATRSPRRVNPIGLSLIQILGVTGGRDRVRRCRPARPHPGAGPQAVRGPVRPAARGR